MAAHSTVRALYGGYAGRMYQVRRSSDGATRDVGVAADGFSDTAAQTSFCAGTSCLVTVVYDQSPHHNDLTVEGPGGNGPQNNPVRADALPVVAGGRTHYGLFFGGRNGYRDNRTEGVATGAQPEGMYMVASGTHFNNQCCFDYGNTETTNFDTGNGHMDAVYLGTWCQLPPCFGSGPWVAADLENGLFQSNTGGNNPASTGRRDPFVTAMTKNNGVNFFAIKDGNAQAGALHTDWAGPLPTNRPGYSPMHKEGGIVLGTGGDNSNGSVGSFFEGAMTAGTPSDATENAVQANITQAGYGGRLNGTTTTSTTGVQTTTTTTGRTTTSTTTGSGPGGNDRGCTASFNPPVNAWNSGFVAQVQIASTVPINSWRVTVRLPAGATVTSQWNGTFSGTSGTVDVTPSAAWNAPVGPGNSKSFGFQANGSPDGISLACTAQ